MLKGCFKMISAPSREQLEQLYDLADRIKKLAPWKFLAETDVFGVRDPETGADYFVSVTGRLKAFRCGGLFRPRRALSILDAS